MVRVVHREKERPSTYRLINIQLSRLLAKSDFFSYLLLHYKLACKHFFRRVVEFMS